MPRTIVFWSVALLSLICIVLLLRNLHSMAQLEVYRQRLAGKPAAKRWFDQEEQWVREDIGSRVLWVGRVADAKRSHSPSGPSTLMGIRLEEQSALLGTPGRKDLKSLQIGLQDIDFVGVGEPIVGERWLFGVQRKTENDFSQVHRAYPLR